jgi:predicted RNase H-like HicB family nuclease
MFPPQRDSIFSPSPLPRVLDYLQRMSKKEYTIETEREEDGRWIAEVLDLPGVLVYGKTEKEAIAAAQALALRVLADRIEEHKEPSDTFTVSVASRH